MITFGQVAVSGTVPLLTIPPGAATVSLATTGGTAYAGASGVTVATGYPVTGCPAEFDTYPTSKGATIYATVAAGTVAACWLLSTPE